MMRLLVAVLLSCCFVGVASAHHKPWHHPPGHTKHAKGGVVLLAPQPTMRGWAASGDVVAIGQPRSDGDLGIAISSPDDLDWRVYEDTVYHFTIELP